MSPCGIYPTRTRWLRMSGALRCFTARRSYGKATRLTLRNYLRRLRRLNPTRFSWKLIQKR
jgi:hypothetical protein